MLQAADHLHHRLRLGCVLVVSVPLLAAQPLLLAVVQPRAGRPVLGRYLLFGAIGAGAPRQPGRGSGVATAAHRLRASAPSRVCGAVFFVELHDPWIFFWMYTGTVMRLALCVEPRAVPARRAGAACAQRAFRAMPSAGRRRQDASRHEPAGSASSGWIVTACCRARATCDTSAARLCSTCCWRVPGAISATTFDHRVRRGPGRRVASSMASRPSPPTGATPDSRDSSSFIRAPRNCLRR